MLPKNVIDLLKKPENFLTKKFPGPNQKTAYNLLHQKFTNVYKTLVLKTEQYTDLYKKIVEELVDKKARGLLPPEDDREIILTEYGDPSIKAPFGLKQILRLAGPAEKTREYDLNGVRM